MSTSSASSIGTTETMVSFLQADLSVNPRIFTLEISADAQAKYTELMSAIQTILHKDVSAITSTDIANLQKYISMLNTWSQLKTVNSSGAEQFGPNGTDSSSWAGAAFDSVNNTIVQLQKDSSGNLIVPAACIASTMNNSMAQQVDMLIRIFRAAGWDPTSVTNMNNSTQLATATAAIQKLVSSATASIYNVSATITSALAAASTAVVTGATSTSLSLQELLMTDYISRGNARLFNEMNSLKQAIDLNSTALSYLNSLQDMMNQKEPAQFVLALQDLNAGLYDANYTQFEKDSFTQPINAAPKFSSSTIQAYITSLSTSDTVTEGTAPATFVDISGKNYTQADVTAALNGDYVSRIINNLGYLVTQIGGAASSDGTGLISSLTTLKKDFQSLQDNAGIKDKLQTWVADSVDNKQGAYQQDLSNAIVASQSLNDTERQNLQQVMFVYQEFYQSATSLLSTFNTELQTIAKNLGR